MGKNRQGGAAPVWDISIWEAEEELAGRHDNSLGQWSSDCWKTSHETNAFVYDRIIVKTYSGLVMTEWDDSQFATHKRLKPS